jgi:hypothetical protein
MPYSVHANADHVEVVLSGRLNYETIMGMLDELAELATAALPERLNVLVDETDASPGLLGPSEIRSWIDRWKRAELLEGRLAVIAPTKVMFGLNRMAQGLAGADAEHHLAVFRNRDDAMSWLLDAAPARDRPVTGG